MKVSFIKYKNDNKSYKMAKGLGMDVFEIDSPELIDKKIEEYMLNILRQKSKMG